MRTPYRYSVWPEWVIFHEKSCQKMVTFWATFFTSTKFWHFHQNNSFKTWFLKWIVVVDILDFQIELWCWDFFIGQLFGVLFPNIGQICSIIWSHCLYCIGMLILKIAVYVEACPQVCNTLTVFVSPEVPDFSRSWNIKISQIPCQQTYTRKYF